MEDRNTSSASAHQSKGTEFSIGNEEPAIPCLHCGNCCSHYQVLLEGGEAQRIAEYLNITMDKLIEKYADTSWPIGGKNLIRQIDGGCSFLRRQNNQALCSIHEVKPQACRDWTPGFSKRECREGLERIWRLRVNTRGEVEGTRENRSRFQEFIEEIGS
jgi:Fe-S-cluster containining protein